MRRQSEELLADPEDIVPGTEVKTGFIIASTDKLVSVFSEVVEVLLAAVRPVKLLAGKVLGIGLVAFAQAGLIMAFALVLASSVGSDLLRGTAPLRPRQHAFVAGARLHGWGQASTEEPSYEPANGFSSERLCLEELGKKEPAKALRRSQISRSKSSSTVCEIAPRMALRFLPGHFRSARALSQFLSSTRTSRAEPV